LTLSARVTVSIILHHCRISKFEVNSCDMTDSAVLEDIRTDLTDGDENRFAHYAESTSVTEGYVLGTPVLAICGILFVPSRDPKKFPICPICKEIAEALFLGE